MDASFLNCVAMLAAQDEHGREGENRTTIAATFGPFDDRTGQAGSVGPTPERVPLLPEGVSVDDVLAPEIDLEVQEAEILCDPLADCALA